jgi:hypothetical protein
MYFAFMLSGMVDLVGFYTTPGTLPKGTDHVRPNLCLKSHFFCLGPNESLGIGNPDHLQHLKGHKLMFIEPLVKVGCLYVMELGTVVTPSYRNFCMDFYLIANM